MAAVAVLVAFIAVIATPSIASAHPLGNFTVNRYARIEVSAGMVRVYYVLDEAELPALEDHDQVAAGAAAFARMRLAELASHMQMQIGSNKLELHKVTQSLDQPKGQAGLHTLRVAGVFEASYPAGNSRTAHHLLFADGNEPDRIGWREIVTVARGDARLLRSTAPQKDVSDELRHYPGDLIQAPLDLRSATVTFTPGSQSVSALPVPRSAPPPNRSGGAFAALITKQNLTPAVLAGMFGLALLVGAGHALLPGHGKTVMAAYLVGTRGRPVDAVFLGVIVSVMHTTSVLLLGFVLFRVDRSVAVDRYYPALTVASGLAASAMGLWLLYLRLRQYRKTATLAHASAALEADHHDGHVHDGHEHVHVPALVGAGHIHEHADGHEHADSQDLGGSAGTVRTNLVTALAEAEAVQEHRHGWLGRHQHGPGGHTHELPADVAPLSRRGLVVLATSGGIVPSPTAVIVVVSAFSLGRIALGLSLIAAFSVGLAVTLTTVGLALVYGRSAVERRWSPRTFRLVPVLGAVALVVLGLVLAARGLTGLA